MLSLKRAYQIAMRCIKAVSGRAEPELAPQQTLEESGITNDLQLRQLKIEINAELAKEGLEFQKMSLDEIRPSTTIKDVALVVSYARTKSETFY